MRIQPHDKTQGAIEYLRAHPELHVMGGKRLAFHVTEYPAGYKVWSKARQALGLKRLPSGGMWRYNAIKKPTIAPLAPIVGSTVIYPDTYRIEIDKPLKTIRYICAAGVKTVEKRNRKMVDMVIGLIERGGWVEVESRAGLAVYERIDTQGGC
jgi:hypothetical protein